jgi:hypothetical protein
MKEIMITYEDNAFFATANPPITLEDEIILFSNKANLPCQITFEEEDAFGILGIALGPGSAFTLVFRGVETGFKLSGLPVRSDTHNPTIPPGSLLRRKK